MGKIQYRSVVLRPRERYDHDGYDYVCGRFLVCREGGYGPYLREWCVYNSDLRTLVPVARRRTLKECAVYLDSVLTAA